MSTLNAVPLRKSVPVYGFKALPDEGEGVFEAFVAVFGNVDHGGDVIFAGAFVKDLEQWKASGDPIPTIFSHKWDDLDSHIGGVLDAKEVAAYDPSLPEPIKANGGLWVKCQIDVDDPDARDARRIYTLLKLRRIKEFSFAYDIVDGRRNNTGGFDLLELAIIEVGPTLKGMNPATELLEVKAIRDVFGSKADHAFIPTDDGKCLLCGKGQTAVAHINRLSADQPQGAKMKVDLTGSVEQRQAALLDAAETVIPKGEANGGFYGLYLEGTFDDKAVFRLEGWDDMPGEGKLYECAITEGAEGIELGEPVEVEITATTTPKSRGSQDAIALKAMKSALRGKTDTTIPNQSNGSPSGNEEDPSEDNSEDQDPEDDEDNIDAELIALEALRDNDEDDESDSEQEES